MPSYSMQRSLHLDGQNARLHLYGIAHKLFYQPYRLTGVRLLHRNHSHHQQQTRCYVFVHRNQLIQRYHVH